MAEPLAVLDLHHARLEFWPDCCRTIFKADGKTVTAAPNGTDTIIDCATHEALHHLVAQTQTDTPSACLRAVADGDGQRWTPERRAEEATAFGMGPLMVALHEALVRAYG